MPKSPGGSEKFKVFISYSRSDIAFADQLVEALEAFGFEPTIDRHSIAGGEEWKARLHALILEAGSVVFVLSPDAIKSEICAWEVEHAQKLAKRIIPILCRALEGAAPPEHLKKLNYIYFYPEPAVSGSGFGSGLARLAASLKTDIDWLREHTRIGGLASRWDTRNQDGALLLRGTELEDAERWLARRPPDAPEAGELICAFLLESRRSEDEANKRKLRDAQMVARITTIGFAVAFILASIAGWFWWDARQQKRFAEGQRAEAIRQRAKAEATADDSAEIARNARQQLSETNDQLIDVLGDLLTWAPPSWKSYVYYRRSGAYGLAGNLVSQRADINSALKADPSLVTVWNSSADNHIVRGEADNAASDANMAAAGQKDAIYLGNLILAEAMRRNYAAAMGHIDEALRQPRQRIHDVESLVAPDVQDLTGGFKLVVRDSDFLLALKYQKAVLYAMMGDERFVPALQEADKSDRDFPFSRTAYLTAINWEWLIARGQALRDAKTDGDTSQSSQSRPPIRDYGGLAALGELWLRVAATRPDYAANATAAFNRFNEMHGIAPDGRYQALAAWVSINAGHSIKPLPMVPSPLSAALDAEVKAIELESNSGDDLFQLAPAIALLSGAIHALDPEQLGGQLGRREEDILIRLLLLRAEWRLKGEPPEEDFGGAKQDALRVLQLDSKNAQAYVLVGQASRDPGQKEEAFEKALALEPANVEAIDQLSSLLAETNAAKALELREKTRKFRRFWASDYQKLAALQAKTKNYPEALKSILRAIALKPWSVEYYVNRREYEIAAGAASVTADSNLIRGYHDRARYYERIGNYENALAGYLLAFRRAAALVPADPGVKAQLDSVTTDFSAFLTAQFGQDVAVEWWRSLSSNPIVTSREKDLAASEAARVAGK